MPTEGRETDLPFRLQIPKVSEMLNGPRGLRWTDGVIEGVTTLTFAMMQLRRTRHRENAEKNMHSPELLFIIEPSRPGRS
jgi:hypothetical protein